MSNSPLVSYTRISPNRTPNRTHSIDTITIHCVVGQCSVETLGNIFAPSSRQASCNYGVGLDGRIGMYVEEKDRSWCSSNAANDHRAVTIEVASDTTEPYAVRDVAYNALIKLVADICKRNGIKKLVWSTDKNTRVNHLNGANMTVHRDYANKSCPGTYLYNHMGDIAAKVNAQLGAAPSAPVQPKPAQPSQPAATSGNLVKQFQQACIADGIALPKFGADGVWGSETQAAAGRTLSTGSRGARVKLVQQICVNAKIGLPDGADGVFGVHTNAAVREYQKQHRLTIDGVVGVNTWKAMLGVK